MYDINDEWVYVRSLSRDCQAGIIPLSFLNTFHIPPNVENGSEKLYVASSDFSQDGFLDLKKGKFVSFSLKLFCLRVISTFFVGQLIVEERTIDDAFSSGYYFSDPLIQGTFPLSHVSNINLNKSSSPYPRNDMKTENFQSKIEKNYSSSSFEFRQAKVIQNFDNTPYLNEPNKYLKLDVGDYVLITKRINDDWLEGENLLGEKGFLPFNYVEFLNDKNEEASTASFSFLISNRTQRRYTLVTDDQDKNLNEQIKDETVKNTNNLNIIPQIKIETEPTILNNNIYSAKYCQVKYDFSPENNNELGCFSGEYLKIESELSDEWIECSNYYYKKGLVPVAFVTFITEQDDIASELFKNQKTKSNSASLISLTSLYPSTPLTPQSPVEQLIKHNTNPFLTPIILTSSQSSNISKSKYERSASSSVLLNLKSQEVNKNQQNRTRSLTPLSLSLSKTKIKPPIPPKPANLLKSTSNKSIIESTNKDEGKINANSESSTITDLNSDQLKESNADKKIVQKKFIITELYETEKSYYNEIKKCYDLFMSNESLNVILNLFQ